MAAIAGAKLLPPPREPGDIAKWAVTALEPKEGGAVRVAELAAPYREWCEANGLEPLDPATFRRLFAVRPRTVVASLTASAAG